MLENVIFDLHVIDHQIFGDQLAASWMLNDYLIRVKESVEYSLGTAKVEVNNRLLRMKRYSAVKLAGLDILDRLFKSAGLKIRSDDYTKPLGPEEIKESEYQEIKKIALSIASGKTNIIIDEEASPEFRQSVFIDVVLLLSRKTSRELILEILKQEESVKIAEWIKNEYRSDTRVLCLDLQAIVGAYVAHTEEGEGFFFPMLRFIILAHELTHFFHHCVLGDVKYVEVAEMPPSSGCKMHKLEEQYVVLGTAGGLAPDLEINEHQICKEFGMPVRNVYQSVNCPPESSMRSILDDGATLFCYAVVLGALLDLTEHFNNGGDLDSEPAKQMLLYMAFTTEYSNDKEAVVSLLIKQGAPVDWADERGFSPLHFAAEMGSLKVCKALLDSGADLNAITDDGETALMIAFRLGHSECADFLIQIGGFIAG